MTKGFATIKIRSPFLAWLRVEAARRGCFLYELIEEHAGRSFPGEPPWKRETKRQKKTT